MNDREKRIARPLEVLTPLIREAIAAGDKVCGEVLWRAKEEFGESRYFLPWAAEQFDCTQGEIKRMMRTARKGYKREAR